MIVRRLPFAPHDPLALWPRLHPNPQTGFVLGSGAATPQDHLVYLSAGEPSRIFLGSPKNWMPPSFRSSSPLPRWVGFFGFEAGAWFDPGLAHFSRLPHPLQSPPAFFGDYPNVVKVDLLKKETMVKAKNRQNFQRILNALMRARGYSASVPHPRESLRPNIPSPHHSPPPIQLGFRFKSSRQFAAMVKKAKAHIAAGDIYQANLSLRFEKKFRGDPVALYTALCRKNPSPYAALLKMKNQWIVSNSPELLLSVEGSTARTRPIAGTRPRGRSVDEDRRKKGQLLLSPKERAEHIMLVDLERNDLGRVCRPGSVRVSERFAIERYSHVMHIVSEVEGRLRNNESALSALAAIFPGGTITGCPKIKSIEIIRRLEGVDRGPFYGSAGFVADNGDAVFNILIRSAWIGEGRIAVQAGSGVVADSHPVREYKEALAKARALLETVREISG